MLQSKNQLKEPSLKERMKVLLEQTITEKVQTIFKEAEIESDKQIQLLKESVKEDPSVTKVKSQIQKFAESNQFKNFGQKIRDCKNIDQKEKEVYASSFDELNRVFVDIQNGKKTLKITINKFIQSLLLNTNQKFNELEENLIKLNQAGVCGKGSIQKQIQNKYHEFELIIFMWRSLPEMEGQNIEYKVVKPNFAEKDFRIFINDQINRTYPEQVGEQQIVEKEVIKYVDKIVEVEKIKYVERIVEKKIEVKVPEYVTKEVIKIEKEIVKVPEYREVVKYLSNQDRLREAHEMLYGFGRPQNVTQALSIYYEEAEVNNNILACNAIGQIFLEGKFFPKDLKKAFQYYEKSAISNDSEGQYRIGNFLYNGIIDGQVLSGGHLDNRDKELSESVSFYQKSSEQGHLEALTELGQIFEYGLKSTLQSDQDIVPPDLEQAEFYYQQAKKVRFPRATCLLGLFYLNNPGYKEKVFGDNTRKAIKYFELALDLGHSKAYYYLAQCYEKGSIDINVNIEKAKHFYKEGSLRGDSQCKVHYMYYVMKDASNSGLMEDYYAAYNYFRDVLSSDPQIPETYFYLGHLYECGYGVSKDSKISMSYYFQGAKLGNADSMNKLGDFYHSGFGVPKNQMEAIQWYQQAAELDNAQAMINLGTMYEDGMDGVIQDRPKAFHYYERASELESPFAFFLIGQMYEAGRYVNKDLKQAIDCYKKSALKGCQQARELLERKNIPMIYDDNGLNINHVTLEGIHRSDGFYQQGFEQEELLYLYEVPPIISNVMLTQLGKKQNQNILHSKLLKQNQGERQYQSILEK